MLTFPAASYCLDYVVGAQFVLAIGGTNSSYMTLGGTFLRNFYTQLNFESPTTASAVSADLAQKASNSSSTLGTVTIALSTYAAPGVSIVKYEPPKPKIQGMVWFWFWLIIILLDVAIYVAILAGVRWLCQ